MPTWNGKQILIKEGPFHSSDAAISFMKEKIETEVKRLREESMRPIGSHLWVPGKGTHEEYFKKTIGLYESITVGACEVVRVTPEDWDIGYPAHLRAGAIRKPG